MQIFNSDYREGERYFVVNVLFQYADDEERLFILDVLWQEVAEWWE